MTDTCDYKEECNDGDCSNIACLCAGYLPGDCQYSNAFGLCECRRLQPKMAYLFSRFGYGPVIVGTVGAIAVIVFWTGIIFKTWQMHRHAAPRTQPYVWYAHSQAGAARSRLTPAPGKPKQQHEGVVANPKGDHHIDTPPFTIKAQGYKLSDGNIIYRGHYYYPDSITRFLEDSNTVVDPPPYSLELLPNLPPYPIDPSSFLTAPPTYNLPPPPPYRASPPPYTVNLPQYPNMQDEEIQSPMFNNNQSLTADGTGEMLSSFSTLRDDDDKIENTANVSTNHINGAVRRNATSSETQDVLYPPYPPPNYTANH